MFPFDPNLTQIVVLAALCAIVASFFSIQFILLLLGDYMKLLTRETDSCELKEHGCAEKRRNSSRNNHPLRKHNQSQIDSTEETSSSLSA